MTKRKNSVTLIEYIDAIKDASFDKEHYIFLLTTEEHYEKAIHQMQDLISDDLVDIPEDIEIENLFYINEYIVFQIIPEGYIAEIIKMDTLEIPSDILSLLIDEDISIGDLNKDISAYLDKVTEIQKISFN